MAKRTIKPAKKQQETRRCWDCIFSIPFDAEWNRTPDGRPITKHCNEDPNNIKRGFMDNTPACSKAKFKV